jgi:hypothetical protein
MHLRQSDSEAKYRQVTCHRVYARFLVVDTTLLLFALACFFLRRISLSALTCAALATRTCLRCSIAALNSEMNAGTLPAGMQMVSIPASAAVPSLSARAWMMDASLISFSLNLGNLSSIDSDLSARWVRSHGSYTRAMMCRWVIVFGSLLRLQLEQRWDV